ncbi:hypothetical protein AWB74_06051 [Caballeronia arvi]|uniref:Uncharacterized protein n=1 Tax=Caballeronia arvi TaxID=1777135 RepID=A0A158KMZ4_9BURK|nr:hypothetical protein [Caballeronia arvi]SAL81771.1 hypothetical protein AWB74_06051 [Caballeronia arvi]
MTLNDYSQFDPRKVDLKAFSKEQWAAIALYREARSQQRKLQMSAVFLAVIVAGVAGMSGMFSEIDHTDPAFFSSPWIRYGIPGLGIFFAVAAVALSFVIVVRAKAFMREWRVPEDLIKVLDRYPTEKM